MPAKSAEANLQPSAGSRLGRLLERLWSAATSRRAAKRLRLSEMLPLGEKRFLAVVECDRQRFLLAATPQNISLLERLEASADGDGALESSR